MKGYLWLSEAMDMKDIKSGVLNIIQAPTGSGKSFYALNGLNKLASINSKYLYVIDTINGREQLLKESNTAPCGFSWEWYIRNGRQEYEIGESAFEIIDESKIVIITYAAFGALTKRIPHFCKAFEVIICDELHSGVEMSTYGDSKNYYNYARTAVEELKAIVKYTDVKVIALTATPTRAAEEFGGMVKYIPIHEHIRRFEEFNTIPYTNPVEVIKSLKTTHRGIIYTPFISEMKRIEYLLTQRGIKAIPVWSIHATKRMTEEQLQARDYIIKNERLPLDVDVLIINKALETGINIRGHIDYIMVHSKQDDVQKQVRGRYRGDLDTLLLYSNTTDTALDLPLEYFGKRLFKEETTALCDRLRIRNAQGNVVGWTTVKGMLKNQGFEVTEGRQSNKRYYKINITDESQLGF